MRRGFRLQIGILIGVVAVVGTFFLLVHPTQKEEQPPPPQLRADPGMPPPLGGRPPEDGRRPEQSFATARGQRRLQAELPNAGRDSSPGHMPPSGTMPEGSPYSAYPLSFPKVLAGLAYFDEKRPAVAPDAEQCRKMVPLIKSLGKAWHETNEAGNALKTLITPAQEAFIAAKKHELETSSGHGKALALLGRKYGLSFFFDAYLGIYAPVTMLCTLRANEPDADNSPPAEWAQGGARVTSSDIATGLILLEEDPESRLSAYQAQEMKPVFEKLVGLNTVVDLYFVALEQLITQPQIDAIGEDIKAITNYKFALWKRPGGPYNDPLINSALEMCRAKVEGGAGAGSPTVLQPP